MDKGNLNNAFRIELENPTGSYSPGDTVDGRVVIVSAKRKKIKEVTIQLKGVISVFWKENAYGHGSRRTAFSAKERCAYCKIVLAGAGINFVELQEGTTEYKFRFILPENIPSSFAHPTGVVVYKIKAEAKRDALLKGDDKTTVSINVNGVLDLNLHPMLFLPQEHKLVKDSNILSGRKGQLQAILKLPQKSGFLCGEMLDFSFEISNLSNRQVTGISVALHQIVTFIAQAGRKTMTKTVVDVEGPEVKSGEVMSWSPGTLAIPVVPPTGLGGKCPIIDLQYLLHFEATISGTGNPLVGSLPITIGTKPMALKESPIGTHQPPHLAPPLASTSDLHPPSYLEATGLQKSSEGEKDKVSK